MSNLRRDCALDVDKTLKLVRQVFKEDLSQNFNVDFF